MLTRTMLALAISVAMSAPAAASIMTFGSLPNGFLNTAPYVEDGITVAGDGGGLGFNAPNGRLHLDDSGTSFSSLGRFTMATQFDAIAFDIFGLPTSLTTFGCDIGAGETCAPITNTPYDNVLVQGRRGSVVVAQESFSGGETSFNHLLGAAFRNLDELVIAAVGPSSFPNGSFCGAPCGHFEIDNVELSSVPAPAALSLLASGLGLLFGAGRIRQKRTIS